MTASILSVLAMIVVGACSAGEPAPGQSEPSEGEIPAAETGTGDTVELPVREGPRRQTTGSVPHIQLDAEPVPAVDAELRRRAFQLPGVENLTSDRSLPGARGLALRRISSSLEMAMVIESGPVAATFTHAGGTERAAACKRLLP